MIMDSESAGVNELAAEFPGYAFGTQPTWDGTSIVAIRQDGMGRPGLCVVITDDVDEMRRTLLEGEATRPEHRIGALDEDRG
jgi:hypothetical protein